MRSKIQSRGMKNNYFYLLTLRIVSSLREPGVFEFEVRRLQCPRAGRSLDAGEQFLIRERLWLRSFTGHIGGWVVAILTIFLRGGGAAHCKACTHESDISRG
jgi:hypothetical protein